MRVTIIRASHQRAIWHVGMISGEAQCGRSIRVDAYQHVLLTHRDHLIEGRKLCLRCWRHLTK